MLIMAVRIIVGKASFMVITYIKLFGCQKLVKFFVVSKKEEIMKIHKLLVCSLT